MEEELIEIAKNLFYSKRIIERLEKYLGKKRVKRIFEAVTKPFERYYLRVNTLKATTDEVIEILEEDGIKAYKDEDLPDAIYVKVEGPNKIPIEETDKKVIVDKATAESVILGADVFVPGIEKLDKFRKGEKVLIMTREGLVVGLGIAMMDSSEISKSKKGFAIKTIIPLYKVPKIRETKAHKLGLIYDQSKASILVGHILDPKPGEKILDMCAAPGGKCTHIAQLTKEKAEIIAVDRSEKKIEKIKINMERLGIKKIKLMVADSRYLHKTLKTKFDKILLDPPCSALGVRPKIYDKKTYKDFENFWKYQRQFFEPAYKLLKPGGILVYSTCTMTIEENEENIKYACEKFGFKIVEQNMYIADRGIKIDDKLEYELLQRFYPDIHPTPGFFIAKLRKIE